MLPPRRIVDFVVVVIQVPSSQNAIVSDMEMKPISPYLTCIPVFLVERHGLFRRADLRIAGSSLSLQGTHSSTIIIPSSQRGLDGIDGREGLAPRQTSPCAQTIVPDLNRQSGHLKVGKVLLTTYL